MLGSARAAPWRPIRELLAAGVHMPASDTTGYRQACIKLAGALRLNSGIPAAGLREELEMMLEMCVTVLPSEAVAKEEDNDIQIYFAPEGKLWREEGTYVAEEVETTANVKKNKYLKGLYDDPDLTTYTRPAAKAAATKSKVGAAGKAKAKPANPGQFTKSDIEAAQIQEQSNIRARIRKLVDEAHYALDVLAALATESNTGLLEPAIPGLMAHAMVLLKSPLTALRTRRALRVVTNVVLDGASVTRKDLLADALLVVAKGWQSREPAAAGTAGDTPVCETVLDSVALKDPIPTSAMASVLPVVLNILANSTPTLDKVCKLSLLILEKQLDLGAKMPEASFPDIIDSLGVALLRLPFHRQGTQAAMVAVSKRLISSEALLSRLAELYFAEDDVVRSVVVTAVAEVQHNPFMLDGAFEPNAANAVLRMGTLESCNEPLASEALEALGLEPNQEVVMELVNCAARKPPLGDSLRDLVAKAVAQVLTDVQDPEMSQLALDTLMQIFREDADARLAVARCLEKVHAGCLQDEDQVVMAFRFLLRQALGITSSGTPESIALRDLLLSAGIVLIENYSEDYADVLYLALEEFEDSPAGAAAGESARLGVAVFMGALSKHLGADHPKVPEILPRLLQRLLDPDSTASVQNAIIKVMPPLIKQNKEKAAETLEKLLDQALAPKVSQMTRRGAALGVGAAVKGLSTQAVSQFQILKRVETASENKKDAGVREGAFFCLEGLSINLGKLFDPYVVNSVPLLLTAFADSNKKVQQASHDAAKVMMAQLTGPGVKQVLKPLLEGVKSPMWRTKHGSIELLSAMTSCMPKQLAACLPHVVPALCVAVSDPVKQVKELAVDALEKVGRIISSPELKVLAPDLINALVSGMEFESVTRDVLDKLLQTSFVHHVDAPSLSLVCPLVEQGLKDRSGDMKRKGVQIVGSMVLLIKDPKDIQPYLPSLLPLLKQTLLDPSPDVRVTSAKAFGTLAKTLPEEMLGDVLPWLFEQLRGGETSVDRSGTAHGLAEVLMAMGLERIEMLLPDLLSNATNTEASPEVRDGYLALYVHLPVLMGSAFEPYLETTLTALLNSLSDEFEVVRVQGFKAGKVLVKQFGVSHTSLLLEPLEEGAFDVNSRIRHAAVSLIGQLIEHILRAHRIATTNAELIQCAALPLEWRQHILATLYIVRGDENHDVKKVCSQVWKNVVQNAPKTLKELLPALMKRLIANLASTNREKQRVAARCVGELAARLGERVMPELMPIFMNTLSVPDAHVREGVCIGLAELINATTQELLETYLEELIPAICQAIIDEEETVRNSASIVVALLHNSVGPAATTDVVTRVLTQWEAAAEEAEEGDDHSSLFLLGMEQMMQKHPAAVLPLVIERMKAMEYHSTFQVQCLSSVACVPQAHTVHVHLSDVLPVLISAASDPDSSEELVEVAVQCAGRVIDRVEQGGLHLLVPELYAAVENREDAYRRAAGAKLFQHFFDNTSLDVLPVLPEALPAILSPALDDSDEEACEAALAALKSLVNKVKKEELAAYLPQVRDTLLGLVTIPNTRQEDPEKLLPGLCEHNGVELLWPIYQHGLMYGSAEQRELAAKGIGEMVNHTTATALKPYMTKITGPLIRIVSDKFPGAVKKAIVDTLKALLVKGGATLKPFLPQLQATYVKCLSDPTEAVRAKAVDSLGVLVRVSGKLEQKVVNDISTGAATSADPAVRQAMCLAFGELLLNVPQPAPEALQEKLLDTLTPIALEGETQQDREAAGWALALVLRRHLAPDHAASQVSEQILTAAHDDSPQHKHGAARVLAAACWCQEPQLAPPAPELLEPLLEAAKSWIPDLLEDDSDQALQTAGMVLWAAAARLSAAASLPLDWLRPHASKSAAAILSVNFDSFNFTASVRAVRHYAGVVAARGEACNAAGAQLAVALATSCNNPKCPNQGLVLCALGALLAPPRSNGGSQDVSESVVRSSVEAFASKLSDDKASRLLREFASTRLRSLANAAGDTNFVWDF